LYDQLLRVAQRKTAEADTKLDKRGKKIADGDESALYGDNVIIVTDDQPFASLNGKPSSKKTAAPASAPQTKTKVRRKKKVAKKVGKKVGKKKVLRKKKKVKKKSKTGTRQSKLF
jgi:hypothetical protein